MLECTRDALRMLECTRGGGRRSRSTSLELVGPLEDVEQLMDEARVLVDKVLTQRILL